MTCFIKRIFQGKDLEKAHPHFVRFGKGTFNDKACLSIQKSKNIKISGSFEYLNDFSEFVSEIENVNFTGKVLSKERLNFGFLSNEKKKPTLFEYEFQGNSEDVKKISDNIYFMLLDCDSEKIKLKTKKKLPRPSKSEKKKIDDKFCVLEIDLKYFDLAKNWFFWDIPQDFKKAKIRHSYDIKEIIMPETKEKDFEKIRLMAKRKGKIKRMLEIDKKEIKFEKDFIV
jgi:hypothetical protein